MLTVKARQALEILRDYPGIGADGFASKMWPRQKGRRVKRTLAMTAGGYISKLYKRGWITYGHPHFGTEYYLSQKGLDALNGTISD